MVGALFSSSEMPHQNASGRKSRGGTSFEMEPISLSAGLSDTIPRGGHSGSVLAVFTLRLPKSLGQWQCRKLPFQPQVAFETVQQGVPIP
jgi:hypothetical protein